MSTIDGASLASAGGILQAGAYGSRTPSAAQQRSSEAGLSDVALSSEAAVYRLTRRAADSEIERAREQQKRREEQNAAERQEEREAALRKASENQLRGAKTSPEELDGQAAPNEDSAPELAASSENNPAFNFGAEQSRGAESVAASPVRLDVVA